MRAAMMGVIMAAVLAGAAAAQDMLRLEISFDPAAAAKLAAMGERVTVSAWYYGEPLGEGLIHVDEMGQVWLGTETFDIWPLDQTVSIGGSLGGAPMGWVAQPMVNVNVYSSRLADQNNLLECDLVDGPFDELAMDAQPIRCKLIGG